MPIKRLKEDRADDLVGIPAIADEVGMNPSSVRKWVSEGRLPAVKDGRKWLVRRAHVFELASSDEWSRASPARARVLAGADRQAPAPPMADLDDMPEHHRTTGAVPRALSAPAAAETLDQLDLVAALRDSP